MREAMKCAHQRVPGPGREAGEDEFTSDGVSERCHRERRREHRIGEGRHDRDAESCIDHGRQGGQLADSLGGPVGQRVRPVELFDLRSWNTRIIHAWGATLASTVTYLTPLVGVTLGILVLGESLHWNEPVGAALVILGILTSQGRLRHVGHTVPRAWLLARHDRRPDSADHWSPEREGR